MRPAQRHLMRVVSEELPVELGAQGAEAGGDGRALRPKMLPLIGDRDPDIGPQPFGEVGSQINFPRSIGTGGIGRQCRKRHLVGDARVVGEQGRGKEALADEAVGARFLRR